MTNQLIYLIIHCTATPEGRAVSKADIIHWHTDPVSKGGRGWNRPGYSDVIYLDGSLINIIPYNTDDVVDLWEISNGALGMNGNSRHVVYVGGMDKEMKHPKDTRTKEQLDTLEVYVKYMLKLHPKLLVLGHREAPNARGKACPSFDVPAWLRSIGIAEKNIFSAVQAAAKAALTNVPLPINNAATNAAATSNAATNNAANAQIEKQAAPIVNTDPAIDKDMETTMTPGD